MAVLNLAILFTLLPAVLAVPQHGGWGGGMGKGWGGHPGHGPVKGSNLPSGFPTGFPHPHPEHIKHHHPFGHLPPPSGASLPPSAAPTSAPFPAGNSTAGGATGSGTGVPTFTASVPFTSGPAPPQVTIISTLLVIPMPVSTPGVPESPESAGVPGGSAPESSPSGAPGSGPGSSPGSGPGSGPGSSPSGAPGAPGSGPETTETAGVCGPAIVTVTVAQTVTITVPPAPETEAPAPEQPSEVPSQPPVVPSAPFPLSNSTVSAGPTAPGTVGSLSAQPTFIAPISPPITPVVAPSSSVAPPPQPPPHPAKPVLEKPEGKPYVPVAKPVEKPHFPVAKPVEQPAEEAAEAPAPAQHAPSVPNSPKAVKPQESSAPKKSSPNTSGVKPRGLLYASGGLPAAQAFDKANIGWCADWDSSVTPGNGANVGSIECQFVPMLHSIDDNHLHWWEANTASGFDYLMAFNEPDNCGGGQGGSCMGEGDAVANWNKYMKPKSGKLVSPAVMNSGSQWMSNFLDQCTDCNIQALAFHWYGEVDDIDSTPGSLSATVKTFKALADKHGIPELWISEMAPRSTPSADQMSAYLKFLEDESNGITRYAFNGLNTGSGIDLVGAVAAAYCS